MVAIGRALMSWPDLLLLDEPTLGLSPVMVEELANALVTLRDDGLSMLLVEQNVHLVAAVTSRTYVLQRGRIVLEGDPREMVADGRGPRCLPRVTSHATSPRKMLRGRCTGGRWRSKVPPARLAV